MRFPVIVTPNVKNTSDIEIIDADGKCLSATEFSRLIGGIKALRLMITEESLAARKSQITSQIINTGEELFCIALQSGKDSNNRVTTVAIILRVSDIAIVEEDENFRERATKAGLPSQLLSRLGSDINRHKMQAALLVKKKKPDARPYPFRLIVSRNCDCSFARQGVTDENDLLFLQASTL